MLDMINYLIRISVKSGIQQHPIPSWFIHWSVFPSEERRCFWAIKRRLQSVRSNLPGHITVFHAGFDKEQKPTVYISREKGDSFTRTCTNICQQTTAKVTSVIRGYNLSGVTSALTRNLCFCGYFQRTASCFSNVILVTIPIWIILEPSIFS